MTCYTIPTILLKDGHFVSNQFQRVLITLLIQKVILGKKIAKSKTGIVIHRVVDENGNESPKDFDISKGNEVC